MDFYGYDFVWLWVAFAPDDAQVFANADVWVAAYVDAAYGAWVGRFEPMDG